ncbi:hypothetical protein H3V53_35655 [Paraburkholderia bengalensis]|uniref:Uncharacterized protein n=1 Tax=Paraburkholderia bengalensis TaxID=2747562 RepID=A0ABU8J363_9BURK
MRRPVRAVAQKIGQCLRVIGDPERIGHCRVGKTPGAGEPCAQRCGIACARRDKCNCVHHPGDVVAVRRQRASVIIRVCNCSRDGLWQAPETLPVRMQHTGEHGLGGGCGGFVCDEQPSV